MAFEPQEPIHPAPLKVAADTFVLRSAQQATGAPLSVYLSSLVIRAREPVLVDTGTRANRDAWLADLASLVDLTEVRWVFLSHDDEDHTGNLAEVLERCPNATLVTTWAATERMGSTFSAPLGRLRWVHDGESLDAGDRVLRAVRPPVFDSPTTRGLFDPTTGVYWASDCFATPMPTEPVDYVGDLPPGMWEEGTAMFHHHALAPWLPLVDRAAYRATVSRVHELEPSVIVGAHTPAISGEHIDRAFDLITALPDTTPPPHPDQGLLDALAAGAVR